MLLNTEEDTIISNCNWTDKNNILVINTASEKVTTFQVNNCKSIQLKRHSIEGFISIEHFLDETLVFSIRPYKNPEIVLSRLRITDDDFHYSGDVHLWKTCQRYYIHRFNHHTFGDGKFLIDLQADSYRGIFLQLSWVNESFDNNYESALDVLQVPGTKSILFSLSRCSELYLYDLERKSLIKRISLASRFGDPKPIFNRTSSELWCADYDTLLKLRVSDFHIICEKRLQKSPLEEEMQFIGEFALTPNEQFCAVARPFSKDVILLDSNMFEIVSSSKSQYQPLDIVVLSDFRFVCRDWKTGAIQFGRFI